MNRYRTALLTLLVSPLTVPADDARKFDTIPQPPAEQAAKQRAEKKDHLKRTVCDIYEKVGEKDPRWDDDARKALELMCRFWAHENRGWDHEVGWRHAEKAVKAGCTDPFIKYIYIRLAPPGLPQGMTKEQIVKYYEEVAAQMVKSKYPPFLKGMSLIKARLAAHHPGNRTEEESRKLLDCMAANLRYLEEMIKDKDPYAQADVFTLSSDLIIMFQEMSGSRKYMYTVVMQVLEKDPGCKKVTLLLKGDFSVKYAWDARGKASASTVTPQGWKDFEERLNEAASALEEAWKTAPNGANPLDAKIAKTMLTVELGQAKGRERMELWFERAMKADPDNVAACLTKLTYLEPKWHGSPEEMLQFGQSCFKTQNWEGFLPMLMATSHYRLSEYLDADAKAQYYRSPAFRADITMVHAAYLQKHADDNYWRTEYVKHLVQMGDLAEARKQVKIIGDNYSRLSATPAAFAELRKKIDSGER
jgi:hypothetical protein